MPERGASNLLNILAAGWPARAAGVGPDDIRPLPGTSEARRWVVGASPGRRLVLTEAGLGAVVAPLAALGAAARGGLRVPRPIPTARGGPLFGPSGCAMPGRDEPAVYFLTAYVAGQPRKDWGQTDPAWLFGLGITVARLHRSLRSLPPDLADWPEEAPPIGLPVPVGHPPRGVPSDQVLHGDLTPGNVLDLRPRRAPVGIRETDPGETADRLGLIDFDRVSRGPVEWDLARALVSLPPWARPLRKGEMRWQASLALLRGYEVGGGEADPDRLAQGFRLAAGEGATWARTARLSGAAQDRAAAWAERVAMVVRAEAGEGPLPAGG